MDTAFGSHKGGLLLLHDRFKGISVKGWGGPGSDTSPRSAVSRGQVTMAGPSWDRRPDHRKQLSDPCGQVQLGRVGFWPKQRHRAAGLPGWWEKVKPRKTLTRMDENLT